MITDTAGVGRYQEWRYKFIKYMHQYEEIKCLAPPTFDKARGKACLNSSAILKAERI